MSKQEGCTLLVLSLSQFLLFFASKRTRDATSSSRPTLALELRPTAVYLEICSWTTDHTLGPRSLILVPTNPCPRASPCCCAPCYFRTTKHTLFRTTDLIPTNSSCAPASPCCCVPCHFRATEHTLGPRSFLSAAMGADLELQRRLDRSGHK